MAVKPFLRFSVADFDVSKLIDELFDVFNSLRLAVTNDKIVPAMLGTAETKVYHGLSSQPASIDVVGLDAGEVVYESPVINRNRDKYVIMLATGPVTARLRFT